MSWFPWQLVFFLVFLSWPQKGTVFHSIQNIENMKVCVNTFKLQFILNSLMVSDILFITKFINDHSSSPNLNIHTILSILDSPDQSQK